MKKNIQPYIKWAAGKRGIMSDLIKHIPKSFNNYFEPFLGGGALFFELQRTGRLEGKQSCISDINGELINTYLIVQKSPEELLTMLEAFAYQHSKDFYYEVRAWDREDDFLTMSTVMRAARFIYLNKTCFNGLYRVNKKNQNNVPIGNYTKPNICDYEGITLASKALEGVSILHQPYSNIMTQVKKGDLIYLDPPYLPAAKTASFTAYDESSFLEKEHKALFKIFKELEHRECTVIQSNSASHFIDELYTGYKIIKSLKHNTISGNNKGRVAIKESIILSKEKRNQQNVWNEEWDFKNESIKLYSHKIHNYPAMFIPQVARKLILKYSQKGDTVLDFFLGSGTTAVESKVLGRNAIGIDLNPLGILISKVKTTYFDKEELFATYSHITSELKTREDFPIEDFKNVDFWFHPTVKYEFSKIKSIINEIKNPVIQDIFKVAFSSIIRKLSYCKHHGFKMHTDKNKDFSQITKAEILKEFHSSFLEVKDGLMSFLNEADFQASTTIIQGDSRVVDVNQEIDLIFTSPPYGDSKTTVAYGQFSRLQSQWLSLIQAKDNGTIEDIDSSLLGGKTKDISITDDVILKSQTLFQAISTYKHILDLDDKKNVKRIKDVISFYKDLDMAIANHAKYLKNDGYMIFIVASRTVKDLQLSTDMIIAELALHYNLILKNTFYRSIPNKRMPTVVSATNIKGELCPTMSRESIVVLKKTELQQS
jgi:DNA adenine methylase